MFYACLCNRPLLHALVEPGIRGGFGVELDPVKVHKARAFIQQTMAESARRGALLPSTLAPVVQCGSVEEVRSMYAAAGCRSLCQAGCMGCVPVLP